MIYNIDNLVQEVENRFITGSNLTPTLAIVMSCSPTQSSISYLKQICKNADRYGVRVREVRTCDPEKIAADLSEYDTDGVIRISDFRGETNKVVDGFSLNFKDVDGMTYSNKAHWVDDDCELYRFPCTALACYLTLLDFYDDDISGKDISIINRSNTIGKPLALLLGSKRGNQGNATVDLIHTETRRVSTRLLYRDAVVTATGVPDSFSYPVESLSLVKRPLVIDVGMGMKDGKLHGDVCDAMLSSSMVNIVKSPGGIGKLTTAILFAKLFRGFRCVTWH